MTDTGAPTLADGQRQTLAALADTFVAAVAHDDDPDGFFARRASDLGVPEALEQYLLTKLPEDQRDGLLSLVDTMAALGLANQPLVTRQVIVKVVAGIAPEARAGVDALRMLAIMLSYGTPDETGRNPFWKTWAYPAPVSAPPETPKTISPVVPDGDTTIETDVVIVGSGSGGGVIAGELAAAGHDVVVLEMGGYFNEADFNQYELWAYENLYLNGGYFPSADGNVSLVAGSVLGGGSLVNWSNSVRPRPDVRKWWAEDHGLEGLDTDEFDAHIDAVLERISANTDCSDFNGPHQRLRDGAEKLGWHLRTAALNVAPDRYDADRCGFTGYGDQTGAKQGTLKTWLQDAADAGGRILVRTRVERIVVDDGRATGVEATYTDPATGTTAAVTVKARHVVAACGSLETPALLLRSGIGGPAVGQNLHLHPSTVVGGMYPQDQQSWWGPPQAAILDEFADKDDGFGYIIEGIQHSFGLLAATARWKDAADHKEVMAKVGRSSWFVGIVQDRGSGTVTTDEAGNAVHTYPLDDELDRRHFGEMIETMIRLQEAAGAEEIYLGSPTLDPWRRGEDLEAFIATCLAEPAGFGGTAMFSAHQMGSARMGTDPATSVAKPNGELHDTAGVWIGDTSAFPTCSGVNPMVSVMSLARRTAGYLADALAHPTDTDGAPVRGEATGGDGVPGLGGDPQTVPGDQVMPNVPTEVRP
ncbi:MAG: FAD-dependent oxidoreductase [Acidimicrobiales bacterium]